MDGVLIVNKEKGFTSHDVVAKLRGICKQKKIGHTGTLDPDATGVLPVCLGRATRLCDMLTEKEKVYETTLLLGRSTDTQDISGKVLSMAVVEASAEEIEKAIVFFVVTYRQLPPMYSAIKVNGKKLYELARQGITVERKPRKIMISEIEILDELNDAAAAGWDRAAGVSVRLRVHCSKGTYIRTLCYDIGEKLGCGGCMAELNRIRTGRFSIAEARTISELQRLADEGKLDTAMIPIEEILSEHPVRVTLPEYDKLLINGNAIPTEGIVDEACICDSAADSEFYRMHDSGGRFIGVYRYDIDRRCYLPEKMFMTAADK